MSAFQVPKQAVVEPFFRERSVKRHKNSPDKREGNDADYLAKIRQLPCCIPSCRATHGIEAHHLRCLDPNRAKGKKPLDKFALPLCTTHHGYGSDGVHKVGTRQEANWFWQHDIDCLNLSTALWLNKHSIDRMLAVLKSHWERR